MRKIDEALISAIRKKDSLSKSNTQVIQFPAENKAIVSLHGSHIAFINYNANEVTVSFRGYATNVTRDRINAVMEAMGRPERFRIKQGTVEMLPHEKAIILSEKYTFTN